MVLCTRSLWGGTDWFVLGGRKSIWGVTEWFLVVPGHCKAVPVGTLSFLVSIGPLCLYVVQGCCAFHVIHKKVEIWSGVADPSRTQGQQNKDLLSLFKA